MVGSSSSTLRPQFRRGRALRPAELCMLRQVGYAAVAFGLMARALWKGRIVFGDTQVPVKLYSAVLDRKVHFRLLHASDGVPVQQRMITESDGVVEAPDIRRGFEIERGVFVVLDPDELAGIEPPPSRDIEISAFVAGGTVTGQWIVRPYWLGPDGAQPAYFALVEALRQGDKEGIARWVMRKRSHCGVLRPTGNHLALLTIRPAQEVVLARDLAPPPGGALDRRELKLAEQLVGALEGTFDPARYKDEYRGRVEELVARKLRGERILAMRPPRKKRPPASLEDALRRSLKQAKERHVA